RRVGRDSGPYWSGWGAGGDGEGRARRDRQRGGWRRRRSGDGEGRARGEYRRRRAVVGRGAVVARLPAGRRRVDRGVERGDERLGVSEIGQLGVSAGGGQLRTAHPAGGHAYALRAGI